MNAWSNVTVKKTLAHWEKFLPKRTAEMEKNGTLMESAELAVKLTKDAMTKQIEAGATPWEAWLNTMEMWIILRPEEEEQEEELLELTPMEILLRDWD